MDLLVAIAPTVIHAEYYVKNIISYDQIVCAIDWQSAALAVGEIDLAALGEGWGANAAQQCSVEYRNARWKNSEAPYDLDLVRNIARLHLQFRWLGDRIEWTTHKDSQWRFEELYRASQSLGLI